MRWRGCSPPPSRWASAELVAGIVGPASSPVVAVGDAVIALTPEPVKDFAIRDLRRERQGRAGRRHAGRRRRSTRCSSALVGLRGRRLGVRRRSPLFGAHRRASPPLTRPAGGPFDALPSLVGAAAGIVALALLARCSAAAPVRPSTCRGRRRRPVDRVRAPRGRRPQGRTLDRRRFLVTGGVALGAAALAGGGGRLLQRGSSSPASGPTSPCPRPPRRPRALPAGADLSRSVRRAHPAVHHEPGLLPHRHRDHRSPGPARRLPARPSTGCSTRPRTYTLRDLYDRDDLIERDITLTCVSNEVGGDLAGIGAVARRPAGRAPARERHPAGELAAGLPLGRRDDDRGADPLGARRRGRDAGHRDERRAAARRARLPGPDGHPRPLRLRVGLQVADPHRGDHLRRVRRLLGRAAAGRPRGRSRSPPGSTPRPRCARSPPAGGPSPASRGPRPAGIARVEVRVDDEDWADAGLAPPATPTCGGSGCCRDDFAPGRHTLTVRATTRTARSRPTTAPTRSPPAPAAGTPSR